jgi:hypothetical protein
MPNIKVSSDIDTFLRKSTKEEAATFLGLEDTKAQWGQITGTLANQTDLVSALALKGSAIDVAINTAKVGITTAQANAIIANTNKVGVTDNTVANTTAVTANTAKVGITTTQAQAITANTAKVGITTAQASAITDNTAKVGITAAQAQAITDNTAKTGITDAQADAITANTANILLKANIASPTFTGNVTVPRLITNEIQSVGTTSGTAQPITYDSKEHRFRDYDETPSNLMVIKKADGVPIGKVGINHNNPVSALHVVGGHTSGGGISNEALRVVGSGLFTSTDQTALVVAGDTDDDTGFSGTLLKLKRDAGTGEIEDEINTGYVGSNGGGIYSNSSANAAFIQVINGRKLEFVTGTTPFRRMQINDTGVDFTGNISAFGTLSASGGNFQTDAFGNLYNVTNITSDGIIVTSGSIGIGTGATPSEALEVNGNIKSSGFVQFGSLTTTERNALTAANGMVIYNTTDNKFQGRENGSWVDLV